MLTKACAARSCLTISATLLALALPVLSHAQSHYVRACVNGYAAVNCNEGAVVAYMEGQFVEDLPDGGHRFAYGQAGGRAGKMGASSYVDVWGLYLVGFANTTILDTLTIQSTDPAVIPGVTTGTFLARIPYSGSLAASELSLNGAPPGLADSHISLTLQAQGSSASEYGNIIVRQYPIDPTHK